MNHYQYMWLVIAFIPQEIINKYNLHDIERDGYICIEIQKGMYGLP